MSEFSIGVDLGGTNLRAAAISRSGQMLGKISGQAKLSAGRDAVMQDIAAAIRQLQEDTSGSLAGVGIGVPGFILMSEGKIIGSNNLQEFEHFPFRDEIERLLGGARVILENDANAAAMGEQWMGAGRGVDDLVLLTLGTGIGGGIVSGGKILHGYLGMAGEIGHITVTPTAILAAAATAGAWKNTPPPRPSPPWPSSSSSATTPPRRTSTTSPSLATSAPR